MKLDKFHEVISETSTETKEKIKINLDVLEKIIDDKTEKKIIIAEYAGAKVEQAYSNIVEKGIVKSSGLLFTYNENSIQPPAIFRTLSLVEIKYDTSYDWLIPIYLKLGETNIDLKQPIEYLFNYAADAIMLRLYVKSL